MIAALSLRYASEVVKWSLAADTKSSEGTGVATMTVEAERHNEFGDRTRADWVLPPAVDFHSA